MPQYYFICDITTIHLEQIQKQIKEAGLEIIDMLPFEDGGIPILVRGTMENLNQVMIGLNHPAWLLQSYKSTMC